MKMTIQQMITWLQGLGRMVAQDVAKRDDLDVHAKCVETSRAFLEVLDGKTDHFPKVIINPSPHSDDVAEAQKNDEAWIDCDVALHDGLARRFSEMAKTDLPSWPDRRSGAYTRDEITDMFLSSVCSSARYWGDLVHRQRTAGPKTDLDCCDGVIFSALNLIDGSSISAPMFDLIPDSDDIATRPAVADFQPLLLDGYMHETYYQTEAFDPDKSPDPTQGEGPEV